MMIRSHSHRRLGELPKESPPVAPFTTASLLWVVHLLYFFQRRRRKKKRHRPVVSYEKLIQRKKFHLVWLAAFSVLEKKVLAAPQQQEHQPPAESRIEVPMGNTDQNRPEDPLGLFGSGIVSRLLVRLASFTEAHILGVERYQRIRTTLMTYSQSVDHGCTFLRLLYHTHLLWSCRALEGGASWSYLCLLLSLLLGGTMLELSIMHLCLSYLKRAAESSPASKFVMHVLRKRSLVVVSLNTLTSAVLMIFRTRFPHVAVPILPFFLPSGLFNPLFSQFSCMLLLGALSRQRDAHIAIWWGCGLGWWCGSSFDEYWGNGAVGVMIILSLLSLRVHCGLLKGWIEHVGFNQQGAMLVFSETSNDWVEQDLWIGQPSDLGGDENDDDMISTTDRADEDEEAEVATTELTALLGGTNMRSRRTAT